MNEHRALINRLLWMQQAYELDSTDVVLQKTPFSFDVSVWEFFWTLQQGATLLVPAPELHKDPAGLIELMARTGVTTAHFVPSMLGIFLMTPGVEVARRCGDWSAAAKRCLRPMCRLAGKNWPGRSCTIFTVRRKRRWM